MAYVQINEEPDRVRVVINIFKALGFLWLKLSAQGWSINMNHKHGAPVSRTVNLAPPIIVAFQKEGINYKLPDNLAGILQKETNCGVKENIIFSHMIFSSRTVSFNISVYCSSDTHWIY